MITIRTGKMGHGKTLNTLKEVEKQAVEEGRPVYYHNLTDLDTSKLRGDWFEFEDPLKWFELPHNAIIIIDEAQEWFRSHDPRKDPPEHLTRFEVMRKGGHHVHLITQDPRFLDTHCRRLCSQHIHYLRIFGSNQVGRYEMDQTYETVEKIRTFKDADFTVIKLDKRFFGVYTSAKASHHFKFKPSKKFVIAIVALVFIGGIVYNAATRIYGEKEVIDPVANSSPTSLASSARETIGDMLGVAPGASSKPMTKADYAEARLPRIANLPSTAPVYDELTRPQSFPRMHCMSSTDPAIVDSGRHPSGMFNGVRASCTCYTQQGTRLNTGFQTCMNASQYGYFDDTMPDLRSTDRMMAGAVDRQPQQSVFAPPQQQSTFSGGNSLDQLETVRVTVIPASRPNF